MISKDNFMAEKLLPHRGHTLECVSYGDWDDPADVCIECTDCSEVLVSAEDFNGPAGEKKRVYAFFFPTENSILSEHEDPYFADMTRSHLTLEPLEACRQNVAAFHAQPKGQDAYIDKWNVIHIVTAHEDRPFAYYFEVMDDCWEDVLGEMGALLDDSENTDMPEDIRKGFSLIYSRAYSKVFPEKEDACPVSRNDLPEFLGQIIDIFEDFLEERNIDLQNSERDERDDPENAAIIYGTDYGELQSELEEMLTAWKVVQPDSSTNQKKELFDVKEETL